MYAVDEKVIRIQFSRGVTLRRCKSLKRVVIGGSARVIGAFPGVIGAFTGDIGDSPIIGGFTRVVCAFYRSY